MTNPEATEVITRIFINEDGDLVVSDLWDEVQAAFFTEEGDELVL